MKNTTPCEVDTVSTAELICEVERMSKKQYKRGKQICTISDFDESPSRYYIVYFGSTNPQTKHRSFLMSWQYRTLLNFIIKGWVFEADRIIEAKASEVLSHQEDEKMTKPENVFVFEVGAFLSQNQLEQIHEEILESIKCGVVVLAPYIKLKAVTGPCTDVEVKIISPEAVAKENPLVLRDTSSDPCSADQTWAEYTLKQMSEVDNNTLEAWNLDGSPTRYIKGERMDEVEE